MTFDPQVTSITQDYIVPKIVDQTLDSNTITLLMLSKGRPWMGESLKFPVKLSAHTQGGSFNDFSTFNTANENVRQTASFDQRGYYQSVVLGGMAMSNNAISKTQLLNLVKVEMESAHQDMVDDIGGLVHGDGTGNSNRDFLGLDAGIDDGVTIATYGGLSRSTYTAWKSIIQTSVGAFDFTKARTLMNSATVGGQKPDILICNETVFGYIEADYSSTVDGNYTVVESARARLTRNGIIPVRDGLTGQAGFEALFYDGSPIVKDNKADSQKLSAINTDFYRWYGVKAAEAENVSLKALYHEGNDYSGPVPQATGFAWTGFVRPHDQYAFVGQLLLMGNLVTPAPRLHSSSAGISS